MCATEGNYVGRPFLTPPPISWPEEFQASSAGGAGAGSGIAAVVMDSRFRTVVRQVAKAFNLPTNEVEEAMSTEAHVGLINDFLGIAGPVRLVVGLLVPEGANQSGAEGLFMTAGDDVRITGKSVLVVRLSEAELTTSNMDSEVMVGVIQGSPIKTLLATLQHVYMPALGQRTSDWAAKLSEESSTEFVGSVGKFVEMLGEAVSSLESGLELAKPEFKYDVENKQPAFNRAAGQPELVGSFEGVVESWCSRRAIVSIPMVLQARAGSGFTRLPLARGGACRAAAPGANHLIVLSKSKLRGYTGKGLARGDEEHL